MLGTRRSHLENMGRTTGCDDIPVAKIDACFSCTVVAVISVVNVLHRNFNLTFVQPALSSKIIMLSHLIAVYHVKIRKDSFELAWIKVAFMCTSDFSSMSSTTTSCHSTTMPSFSDLSLARPQATLRRTIPVVNPNCFLQNIRKTRVK